MGQKLSRRDRMSATLISPRCTVVIPAFNEAETIGSVLDSVLREISSVIVVNDASTDATAAIVASRPVRLISLKTNSGKASALMTGFQHAIDHGVDYIITLDGDGQHDAGDLPKFLQAAARFPRDLVVGARILEQRNAPKARLLANRFADFWVSWAAGQAIADSQCGYRCFPVELLRQIEVPVSPQRGFVFESEFIIEASRRGRRITSVSIRSCYPTNRRRSHFRPVTDITRITIMVAWKLLSKGLFLKGLFDSLRSRPHLLAD